jgi:hypothetical protein
LRVYFLALLAVFHPFAHAQENLRAGTSIWHVTIVDVATGTELKNQTVVIEGNQIASVSTSDDAEAIPPGAIDGHGAYLIPGLWDMHVHVHDTDELPLYVANGITGVRMMAGEKDTAKLRAELAKATPSPEIFLASAIVDGPSPTWPSSIVIKNPADARRAVDQIKAGGADFIKVYNGIPKSAYFALAEEAKTQGLTFVGHVPDAITVQEASDAGQHSIEHLTGIALACSDRQQGLMGDVQRARFFRDRQLALANAYNSYNAAKCQALFSEFRRNDTWQVPTLTVLEMWGRLDDGKFTSDKRLAYVGRRSRERWDERLRVQRRMWGNLQYSMERQIFSADKKIVGMMFQAGVRIMAGTDAMNPYCIPGFGLHDELALLVDAGLTPLAALQAATINPAQFMGRNTQLGTITASKRANLVLLSDDPLIDIHNTTHIQAVWLQGEYFDRAALDKMLATAKQNAAKD